MSNKSKFWAKLRFKPNLKSSFKFYVISTLNFFSFFADRLRILTGSVENPGSNSIGTGHILRQGKGWVLVTTFLLDIFWFPLFILLCDNRESKFYSKFYSKWFFHHFIKISVLKSLSHQTSIWLQFNQNVTWHAYSTTHVSPAGFARQGCHPISKDIMCELSIFFITK